LQVRQVAEATLSDEQQDVVARFLSLPDLQRQTDEPMGQHDGPLALARRMFLQAALSGDRRAALTIVTEALRSGTPIEDVYIDVLQDGLYEVGRRWERNTITVAQEHMATAVTQFVMAHVFEWIERPEASRGRVVLTGVPGELHHVGALMVGDMLEARGWNVQFLGSNLPLPSVVAAVRDSRPDILGISVTMLFNIHHAAGLIAAIRALDQPPRVVVGGAAFRGTNQWQATGADGYAPDLKSALALLCG
jgi:MerR family transcriptional regulator, light-induced transcriptional regulator